MTDDDLLCSEADMLAVESIRASVAKIKERLLSEPATDPYEIEKD